MHAELETAQEVVSSGKVIGGVLVFLCFVISYLGAIIYWADEKDNGWIIWFGFLGPCFLLGILLWIFG